MGEEYIRTVDARSLVKAGDKVILYDSFEEGISFTIAATGSDWRAHFSQNFKRNFANSLFLRTRITSPAANDTIQANWYTDLRPSKQVKLSLDFLYNDLANVKDIRFWANFKYSTVILTSGFLYDPQNTKWQYYNSAGSFTDIIGGSQALTQQAWHHIEASIDLIAKQYVSLICGNSTFSLAPLQVQEAGGPPAQEFYFGILVTAQGSTPPEVFLSNLLILKN